MGLLHGVRQGAGHTAVNGGAGSEGGPGPAQLPLEFFHLGLGRHLIHLFPGRHLRHAQDVIVRRHHLNRCVQDRYTFSLLPRSIMAWNSLPQEIIEIQRPGAFRNALATALNCKYNKNPKKRLDTIEAHPPTTLTKKSGKSQK